MKISLTDLEQAQQVARQRIHLTKELDTLDGALIKSAVVRVEVESKRRGGSSDEVQVSESGQGEISVAIRDFLRSHFKERIAKLDAQLKALGIEIEGGK